MKYYSMTLDRIGASLRYWWARLMITRLMLWLCPPRRKPIRTVKSGDWGDPSVWEGGGADE